MHKKGKYINGNIYGPMVHLNDYIFLQYFKNIKFVNWENYFKILMIPKDVALYYYVKKCLKNLLKMFHFQII
jgi:hypothetical protein